MRTYRIIKYINLLQKKAKEKKISRTDAGVEGSFYKFIRETGGDLLDNFDKFQQDFVDAFSLIQYWECQDIRKHFEHMKERIPVDSTKLECFLPSKEGVGILTMALWNGREGNEDGKWTGLPNIQNTLFQLIHGNNHDNKRKVSPYNLNEDQVLSVDLNQILKIVNVLFIVPSHQPRFSKDLHVIESLCKYGAPRLALYPCLNLQLPEFGYGLEGILSLFSILRENLIQAGLSFSPLPTALATSTLAFMRQAPHISDTIFSFCGAILVQEAVEGNPARNEVLQMQITIPLNEEQRKGHQILSEIPGSKTSFHIKHIPAMMGLCWAQKPQIHESANVPIENEDYLKNIEDGFMRFVKEKNGDISKLHMQIPALLACLRGTGVAQFTGEINEYFANTPLYYYVDLIEVPAIVNDYLSEDDHPFNVPVKHFGHLLRTAEKILGPHEFSTKNEKCVKRN